MSIDFVALKSSPEKLIREFGMEECLSADRRAGDLQFALSYNAQQIRNLLIEEDYLARVKSSAALPQPTNERVERQFVSAGPALQNAQALTAFGDCVTFNDRANADALLRTDPKSPAERTTATALAPTLGRCLPQGQSLKLPTNAIRNIVADSLWHRYVRPTLSNVT